MAMTITAALGKTSNNMVIDGYFNVMNMDIVIVLQQEEKALKIN